MVLRFKLQLRVLVSVALDENLDTLNGGVSLSKAEKEDYQNCVIQISATATINGETYKVVQIANQGFFKCGFEGVDLTKATNLVTIGNDAFNSAVSAVEYSYTTDSIFIPKSVKHYWSICF